MAKRCPRCGLPKFDWRNAGETPSPTCSAMEEHADRAALACRDREIELLKHRLRIATLGLRSLRDRLDGVLAASGEGVEIPVAVTLTYPDGKERPGG